jgi:hypothetical protein
VMKRICTKWGFWEEGDDLTPVKGGVSLLSHSNGSVAHGWREHTHLLIANGMLIWKCSKTARAWSREVPSLTQSSSACGKVMCAIHFVIDSRQR